MSNLNTDAMRKLMPTRERYFDALDEIDRQAAWFAERDKDPKLFVEEKEAVIQHTKEACKARIISSFAGHDIHSLDPVNITIDEILEAIDSVGGTKEIKSSV